MNPTPSCTTPDICGQIGNCGTCLLAVYDDLAGQRDRAEALIQLAAQTGPTPESQERN
ncbi:hypothetical protein [Salininema proteolyticum]|uniref:Uncharacterized protein n=1 Tax=Salininema proteolyticum TaxID=1607685 RepID=A0ABV8TTK3_9ACTN